MTPHKVVRSLSSLQQHALLAKKPIQSKPGTKNSSSRGWVTARHNSSSSQLSVSLESCRTGMAQSLLQDQLKWYCLIHPACNR